MAVCMIMPQVLHLDTGLKLEFVARKSSDGLGGCVVDVHEKRGDGAVVSRISFTPGGQVMRVRRLTEREEAGTG